MTELCIDHFLASVGLFDPYFESVKAGFGPSDIISDGAFGDRYKLAGAALAEGMPPILPNDYAQIRSFITRVKRAEAPEDFAVFALAKKFGLTFNESASSFVRDYLDGGLVGIGRSEVEEFYRQCCCYIRARMTA